MTTALVLSLYAFFLQVAPIIVPGEVTVTPDSRGVVTRQDLVLAATQILVLQKNQNRQGLRSNALQAIVPLAPASLPAPRASN